MNDQDIIINTLKDVYNGNPWHGPSITNVLSKLSENKLNAKIGNGHSIVELILHIVAWRTFAIKKLKGDHDYNVDDEANFPKGRSLKDALDQLDNSQAELMDAINHFDPQKLNEEIPGKKYSYYKMIAGITHHDLYHLGQIVMITKQF
ncbi:MAG TPA: DinB family protein [Cyclobacteriaceae bacterium]